MNTVQTVWHIWMYRYSELNLNQYGVASPCRTICTVCGSPPCPDLNLIHYSITRFERADNEMPSEQHLRFGRHFVCGAEAFA